MIRFQDIDAKVVRKLGKQYSNKAHDPSQRVGYTNSALQHLAMSASFPFLILTYEITIVAGTLIYTHPLIHSAKKLFLNDQILSEGTEWATPEEYIRSPSTLICVDNNRIILPAGHTMTGTLKTQYRGLPTKVKHGDESTYSINLPEDTEEAIYFLSCFYGSSSVNEDESAKEQLGLYNLQENLLRSAYGNPAEERKQRVSQGHNFMGPPNG